MFDEEIKNCIFTVWNYKYNKSLACKIVKKLDDKFVRVIEYPTNGDSEIHTVVGWTDIKNKTE